MLGLLVCVPSHCKEITIVSDPICPLVCTKQHNDTQLPGYVLEIAKAIFGQKGQNVEFLALPYARAIQQVRAGQFDAIITLPSDAPDFVFPLENQGVISGCFYSNQSDAYEYTPSTLEGKVMGLTKGPNYQSMPQLASFVKKFSKTEYITWLHGPDASKKGFRMLLKRRIDAIGMPQKEARWIIDQEKINRKIKESGCFTVGNIYIGFSPVNTQSKHYANQLSDGMNVLRTTGQLGHILEKYNLKDWK